MLPSIWMTGSRKLQYSASDHIKCPVWAVSDVADTRQILLVQQRYSNSAVVLAQN